MFRGSAPYQRRNGKIRPCITARHRGARSLRTTEDQLPGLLCSDVRIGARQKVHIYLYGYIKTSFTKQEEVRWAQKPVSIGGLANVLCSHINTCCPYQLWSHINLILPCKLLAVSAATSLGFRQKHPGTSWFSLKRPCPFMFHKICTAIFSPCSNHLSPSNQI